MSWKSVNKSNAIERAQLYIQFDRPIMTPKLDEISSSLIGQYERFGFMKPSRSMSIIQNLPDNLELGIPFTEKVLDGWVLNRETSEDQIVETVGLRSNVFGYVVTEYDQWTSFSERFLEIFKEPLQGALEERNLSSIKLKVFNKFLSDGDSSKADISKILKYSDPVLKNMVNFKDYPWHTELGWYEAYDNFGLLSQLFFNAADVTHEEQTQRQIELDILVEIQSITGKMSIELIQEYMEKLHERANFLFGNSIEKSIYERMK